MSRRAGRIVVIDWIDEPGADVPRTATCKTCKRVLPLWEDAQPTQDHITQVLDYNEGGDVGSCNRCDDGGDDEHT